MVHGLAMAQAALAPGLAVCLLSGPGAGAYAGVAWWRALVAQARAIYPATPCTDILDCGASAGRALEALRAGQHMIVLQAPGPIWADIAARAAQMGAVLLPEAPPCLDLAQRGAARHLQAWLMTGQHA